VRAKLPTNDKPICVRVLKNETPIIQKIEHPHGPFANISPSIVPPDARFNNKRSSL